METDKLTNAELAEALTNFCDNARCDVNKDSLDCVKEAVKRILGIDRTVGFPSKESIRIAQAIEDGLIQASNFAKYGNWKSAYLAFCQAKGIQNVKDGFKWLYSAEG